MLEISDKSFKLDCELLIELMEELKIPKTTSFKIVEARGGKRTIASGRVASILD